MSFDAIIIADFDTESFSGSNPLRLDIDGRTADVQLIMKYIRQKNGVTTVDTDAKPTSWASAPKLNGLFLYSFLSSRNFDVHLIDNYHSERDQFCRLVADKPRAVIISTTFITNRQDLVRLVDDIRSVAPDIYIIAGGSFIYSSSVISERYAHSEFTEFLRQDYIFLGGSDPAVDLYLMQPQGYQFLPDVLVQLRLHGECRIDFPASAKVTDGSYRFFRAEPGYLPVQPHRMGWHSVPPAAFSSGVVPMESSSGCTSSCAFCNFVKKGRKNTLKPLEIVEDELEAVAERGARYVWFVDDHFRLGEDIDEFCRRLVQRNLNLKWMSFVRADALAGADFDLLRKAGCKEVQLGLESADPKILMNMNKKAKPTMYTDVIQKLLAVGIDCTCYFIFGFPGETEATIKGNVDFINNIQAGKFDGNMNWSIYPFILAPLSPIFESAMRRKHGLSGYMYDWKHETMDAKAARKWIKYAFINIDSSSAVYRGDDLDILESMSVSQRKKFMIDRHRLAQLTATQTLSSDAIVDVFKPILAT